MNTSRWLKAAVLATASFFTVGTFNPTTAGTFDAAEVNSNNFIVIAAPYGNNQRQLLIVEQISNKRPCWSESGNSPVSVEPLLLNFDFTGICGRSNDSNGFSIRMNGEDLGLDYILRVVERNGDHILVGSKRTDFTAPEIEIGRTGGVANGFEKITLNPGWRLTRRTYQGKPLGHIYITSDSALPANQGSNTGSQPLPPSSSPQPLPSNSQPQLPSSQPLPPNSQSPERELIFTKPQSEPTTPGNPTPATSPQTSPSSTTPERTIPAIVVPTQPAEPTPGGQTPTTSPQTVPTLPSPKSTIPTIVVPTN